MHAERTLEDAEEIATVTVSAGRAVDRLELMVDLPHGVEVVDGGAARSMRLQAGEERELGITLRSRRWGLYDVGAVRVRARDPWRLVTWESRIEASHRLKAYPRPLTLRRLLAPMRRRRSPAARSRERRATGSNTRTSATSSPATASDRSTGGRPPDGRGWW